MIPAAPTPGDLLTSAFHDALGDDSNAVLLDELRRATLAFKARCLADALPAEKSLVALKTLLAREGRWLSLAPESRAGFDQPAPEHRVYERVFHWWLEAYFRGDTPMRALAKGR
jgi:hypothetical protein